MRGESCFLRLATIPVTRRALRRTTREGNDDKRNSRRDNIPCRGAHDRHRYATRGAFFKSWQKQRAATKDRCDKLSLSLSPLPPPVTLFHILQDRGSTYTCARFKRRPYGFVSAKLRSPLSSHGPPCTWTFRDAVDAVVRVVKQSGRYRLARKPAYRFPKISNLFNRFESRRKLQYVLRNCISVQKPPSSAGRQTDNRCRIFNDTVSLCKRSLAGEIFKRPHFRAREILRLENNVWRLYGTGLNGIRTVAGWTVQVLA